MVEYLWQKASEKGATRSGMMEVKPHQLLTIFAADELLILITSVRYVTKFDATPLNANLSIPAITVIYDDNTYNEYDEHISY